jgi:hypothetical protein
VSPAVATAAPVDATASSGLASIDGDDSVPPSLTYGLAIDPAEMPTPPRGFSVQTSSIASVSRSTLPWPIAVSRSVRAAIGVTATLPSSTVAAATAHSKPV